MRLWAGLPLALLLLAGCAGTGSHPPSEHDGAGTDPSLPGVRVSGNATWDGGRWVVHAEATNEGTRTYRIDTGCDTPFSLEAKADSGDPYSEVRCLAYTPPIPFRPGETVRRSWTIDPGDFGWSGTVRFAVEFEDAENVGRVRVPLS